MSLLATVSAMDPLTIAAFMGAALILYLTPGADMMFTLASGVSGGPKAGVAAAAGISTGVLIHVFIAAAGMAALLAASPVAFDIIRYAGAAYLAYLAWATWRAAPLSKDATGQKAIARAFTRGLLTNLLNPKVALFILALLPQFTDPTIGPVWQQILALGTLLAIGGFLTDAAYGLAAGALATRLQRSGRLMNRLAAALFGALAARIAIA